MRAVLIIALAMLMPAAAQERERRTELTTNDERWSYAIGMNIGNNLRLVASMIDIELLIQGLEDVLEGDALLTQERGKALRLEFRELRQMAALEEFNAKAAENLAQAQEFLARNGAREGVITTASGLQYEVFKEGAGPRPTASDTVVVHCRKMHLDETVYEDSNQRGEPYIFVADLAVPGWLEGMTLMKPGSRYRLYIPPELGHGKNGRGKKVGPNEVLIFDVDLLRIGAP